MSPRTRAVLLKFLLIGATSFGGGRSAYLYEVFVRSGWIPEELFLRDFAMSQILPGTNFTNTTVLSGLRLGGPPVAVAGTVLMLLPGTLVMFLALNVISAGDPTVARALHGVIVGAVGVILSSAYRMGRTNVRTRVDIAVVVGALALSAAGVPLLATLAAGVVVGLASRRAMLVSRT